MSHGEAFNYSPERPLKAAAKYSAGVAVTMEILNMMKL
jgi:hypothetical protein